MRQIGKRIAQCARDRLPIRDLDAGHCIRRQRHRAHVFDLQRRACARTLTHHDEPHVLRTYVDTRSETLHTRLHSFQP
jgi:hypothetical protein